MFKTFFNAPLAGLTTALLGWIAAIALRDAIDPATFSDLRYGWHGLLVGCVAAAAALVFLVASDIIDPLMTLLVAGGMTAYLWDRTDLPFGQNNSFGGAAPANYWTTLAMMAVVLGMLLLGLRAARSSTDRARG